MPRRGRCRCGTILTFHKSADGYKERCPSCGSVVRLKQSRRQPALLGPSAVPVTPQIYPPALVPVTPGSPGGISPTNLQGAPPQPPGSAPAYGVPPAVGKRLYPWVVLIAVFVAVLAVAGVIGWCML